MFSRFQHYRVLESIAECKRVLQSITECYRVLTSITKCYRVLHSVPECYRVLENATENNTVLQSINDYYRSENDLFLTLGLGTSSAWNKNLRPLLNTNIPLISGKYGLRKHFWPLESRFLMRKNEKKSIFSKPPQFPILSSWILNLHIIMCQFQKKIHR